MESLFNQAPTPAVASTSRYASVEPVLLETSDGAFADVSLATSLPALAHKLLQAAGLASPETEPASPLRYLVTENSDLPDGLAWVIVVLLVLMSGLFSGLTLGLLGLDKVGLDIVSHGEDRELAKCAKAIQPVREDGNRLLCTLLLGNVAVNSLLSIILANLTSGMKGFFISTAVIVIFGEIIPQATCCRYALQIGSRTVLIVRVILFLFAPLAIPLAFCLDTALGDEIGTIHSRKELMRLLQIHVQEGALKKEEGDLVTGALKFRNKRLSQVMTKLNDCFLLHQSAVLDYATLLEISNSGFSRIPVYGDTVNDIVGVLVTKDLIFVNPEDKMPLLQFLKVFGRQVERFYGDDTCGEALRRFKRGRAHLGLVERVNDEDPGRDPFYELQGLVTLEDVIEEILQDEIVDETDVFIEMGGKALRDEAGNLVRQDARALRFFNPEMRDAALLPQEVDICVSHLLDNITGPAVVRSSINGISGSRGLVRAVSAGSPVQKTSTGKHRKSDGDVAEGGTVAVSGSLHSICENGTGMAVSSRWRTEEERRVARGGWLSRKAMLWLFIEEVQVETLTRKAARRCPTPASTDWLYREGVEADFMIIILTGTVMVSFGRERFQQECGSFTVMGVDALGDANGASSDADADGRTTVGSAAGAAGAEPTTPTPGGNVTHRYRPDFSAAIWSDMVTIARVTRSQYDKAREMDKTDTVPELEPATDIRLKQALANAKLPR